MSDQSDADLILFRVLLRCPEYPVIILSADRLRTATDLQSLAMACVQSTPHDGKSHVTAVDATGSEFWYSQESYVISPGFIFKKWTKKRLIDLYNQSVNARDTGVMYSDRSLGNKPFVRVFTDLCSLIEQSAGV